MDQKNNVGEGKNNGEGGNAADKKKPHIKKPLNAFMLYMKEMRAKVVAECTLKESAAINQILGRRVSATLLWVFVSLCGCLDRVSEKMKEQKKLETFSCDWYLFEWSSSFWLHIN